MRWRAPAAPPESCWPAARRPISETCPPGEGALHRRRRRPRSRSSASGAPCGSPTGGRRDGASRCLPVNERHCADRPSRRPARPVRATSSSRMRFPVLPRRAARCRSAWSPVLRGAGVCRGVPGVVMPSCCLAGRLDHDPSGIRASSPRPGSARPRGTPGAPSMPFACRSCQACARGAVW